MRADVVWPAVWAVCFVVGVIYGTMMESPGLLPLRTNLRGGAAAGSSGGGSVVSSDGAVQNTRQASHDAEMLEKLDAASDEHNDNSNNNNNNNAENNSTVHGVPPVEQDIPLQRNDRRERYAHENTTADGGMMIAKGKDTSSAAAAALTVAEGDLKNSRKSLPKYRQKEGNNNNNNNNALAAASSSTSDTAIAVGAGGVGNPISEDWRQLGVVAAHNSHTEQREEEPPFRSVRPTTYALGWASASASKVVPLVNYDDDGGDGVDDWIEEFGTWGTSMYDFSLTYSYPSELQW